MIIFFTNICLSLSLSLFGKHFPNPVFFVFHRKSSIWQKTCWLHSLVIVLPVKMAQKLSPKRKAGKSETDVWLCGVTMDSECHYSLMKTLFFSCILWQYNILSFYDFIILCFYYIKWLNYVLLLNCMVISCQVPWLLCAFGATYIQILLNAYNVIESFV